MARGWLAAICLEHWRWVSLVLYHPCFMSEKSLPRAATLKPRCRKGYSQHGDYVFGWKDDSLQRAMNARCTGDSCAVLKSQSAEDSMKCTKSRVVNDDIDGCESYTLTALLIHTLR